MKVEPFDISSVKLAHPGKRYQGQFLDGLIALSLFGLMMFLSKSLNVEGQWVDVLIILVPFLYFALSDALPGGQSLGKKPFKLAVISKKTGKPCTLWQSFVRNAFSPILGVIDALMILGKKRQRLGDIFANTVVIKI